MSKTWKRLSEAVGLEKKSYRQIPATNRFAQAAQADAKPKDGKKDEPEFDPMGTDADYQLPDFGNAKSAATDVSTGDDYKSPFGSFTSTQSSWDSVPAWMRDADKMPTVNGGSKPINPHTYNSVDDEEEDMPGAFGLKPVGDPWQAKDVNKASKKAAKAFKKGGFVPAGAASPKKPGLLSRIFGRKK